MSSKKRTPRRRKATVKQRGKRTKWLYLGLPFVVLLLLGGITGWFLTRSQRAGSTASAVRLAPASQLSGDPKVALAPPVVREAYRFAIANRDVLAKLPCYCGCGGVGHTSNADCFIDSIEPDGRPVFSYHALG